MSIVANQKSKTGWVVQLVYKIALSKKDLFLLENIKNFFKNKLNLYFFKKINYFY